MVENKDRIPRIIHYCWFGGNPLPDLALRCIESWKKYCPGFQIVEWNEKNFDLDYNIYVREAYDNKKWAFITDVVRLYVLTNYGGIYMDTDVEVIKPLDSLLKYQAVSGFESDTMVPTGLMACEKGNLFFSELLSEYDNLHFILEDGSMDTTTNVIRITNACLKYGLDIKKSHTIQTVRGFTLLPKEYLCPRSGETGDIEITENTLTIHWFAGSWLSERDRKILRNKRQIQYKIPGDFGAAIATIYEYTYVTFDAFRKEGLKGVYKGVNREIIRRSK